MLQPQDAVLVGVSGGPDSVALLHALVALGSDLQLRLGIAHLNHGLRQEASDGDAEFVSSLGQWRELPVHSETVDAKAYQQRHRLSPEEAGRRLRYRFYRKIAARGNYAKLALGHHADDNAESILMHVLRGTGPLGLAGIPPVRDGWIIRPLIQVRRSEILEFLNQNKFAYAIDASNQDVRYLRNHIRHHLMPYLEKNYHPKISDALNRLGRIARDEENWQEALLEPLMASTVLSETPDHIEFSIEKLAPVHVAAKRRIIRKAVVKLRGSVQPAAFSHIDAVVALIENGPSSGSLDLPAGLVVCRNGDRLVISQQGSRAKRTPGKPGFTPNFHGPHFEYPIGASETTLRAQEIGICIQFTQIPVPEPSALSAAGQQVAFFDMGRISFPLVLRNVRPGDRFVPLGAGGTQKLKKYFINNKIPRDRRRECPVLVSGEKIIWLVGHRIDDSVKVTPQTQNVLKAELFIA